MEEVKNILMLLISWPGFAFVVLILFGRQLKKLIDHIISSSGTRAKIGPLEIDLKQVADRGNQAVDDLVKINQLMAESRLLELEITYKMFGSLLSDEQNETMKNQIEDFKKYIKK